jgi:Coenzyme PQQ synthesis protein D (PqqD)
MRPSPNVVYRDLDGEAVLLDLSSGTYFGLNEVGTRVWQLVDGVNDEAHIVATLAAEYDADPAVIAKDVARLLEDLRSRRLLVEGTDGKP